MVMANPKKRLPENVNGPLYVDRTCINCDTCRQLAPEVFGDTGEFSFVQKQPEDESARRAAARALLACPTGSIGGADKATLDRAREDFPLGIEGEVYYCGYNSPGSYGGNSYFIRHGGGNWLIDSPKFLTRLVERLESWGGIRYIFLSHRDDVADAELYARHFSATRLIHEQEADSQPGAEWILSGFVPIQALPGFQVIPTPGHTAGHCALLYRDRFLFTGDHLDWDREEHRLDASHDYCWDSWPEQIRSIRKLQAFTFEWVLPGHGQRVHLAAAQMRQALAALVHRLERG
jgi:glyoxylase-like metal-dependent hydrolase (beta-lactamase superfamily II)/ferredoxin